ncbi:hypothetical protein Hte_002562 [Hypoxylon texense]
MAPIPTPYGDPWEKGRSRHPRPAVNALGKFFSYPGKGPCTFSDAELQTDADFTPPPLDEQYIFLVEDVELGYRDDMVWHVPSRDSDGRLVKNPETNRTTFTEAKGRFPVQFGFTFIDSRDVLREIKKATRSGIKAKKANTVPGRFGKRWMELGLVRVHDVVIKEYMKDYHPDRGLTDWKQKIAPYMGAFVDTKQVSLDVINNHLEGFWSGLETRNLTEQEQAVGYKRKIVMAAWAWDAARKADVSTNKAFWTRAHSTIDIQKWEVFTRRQDHGNNGRSLAFVCDKLGVPHHDGEGRDICHEACNDSLLTMSCILAAMFMPRDAVDRWLAEVDLDVRRPINTKSSIAKHTEKNEEAYRAGSSAGGALHPRGPRGPRK